MSSYFRVSQIFFLKFKVLTLYIEKLSIICIDWCLMPTLAVFQYRHITIVFVRNFIEPKLYMNNHVPFQNFHFFFSDKSKMASNGEYHLIQDLCKVFSSPFHILIFSSETAQQIDLKSSRKHLCKILYKDCSFRPDPLTNMAATGNSCF